MRIFDDPASQWPALLGLAYLIAVSPRLALIDIRHRRLPNRLVLPALPVTLLGQCTALAITAITLGDALAPLLRSATSLVLALAVLGLGILAHRRGQLGMGDVKLMVATALALGWFSPLLWLASVTLAFVLAGLVLLVQAFRLRVSWHSTIALGPYLLVANLLACLALWLPAPYL